MIIMFIGIHVECQLHLSDCNEIEYSRQIFEKYAHIKFNEVGAELFHADGRTDTRTDGQT